MLQQKVATLRQLMLQHKHSVPLAGAIDEVGKIVPTGIFLTEIGYKKSFLSFFGIAPTWDDFLSFMNGLLKSSRFAQVSPGAVKRLPNGAVNFEVMVVPR